MEVRWSSDEGSVTVVQELGACWKCAGAVLRRDRDGSKGARCAVEEVRWSSYDRTMMVVKELPVMNCVLGLSEMDYYIRA